MKKFLLSFNLVILLSVFLTPLEALAGNKKGYALIQINIKNHELFFSTYGQKVPPIVAKYGGKALVATPAVDLKEGNWNHNWSVVLEFPSKKKALNWYPIEINNR